MAKTKRGKKQSFTFNMDRSDLIDNCCLSVLECQSLSRNGQTDTFKLKVRALRRIDNLKAKIWDPARFLKSISM